MFRKPNFKNLLQKIATIIISAIVGGTVAYQSVAIELCGAVASEVIAPSATIEESGGTINNHQQKPLEDLVSKLLGG